MAMLEEFKREFVQELAYCMIEKREPYDLMWSRLNKEYGCDCHLLWERIRTLTVKKLAKMLAAEDRIESIASIARMTSIDWLVFDKILFYKNIDVIGQELILSGKPESKVLWELFILVCSYRIESLASKDLVKGWLNLTKRYNTSGRFCSPMLLQRRWYQLKELVRNIYFIKAHKPTKLQRLIAKKYCHLTNGTLLPWESLIKKKLVVPSNVLEHYNRINQFETTDNDADLIEIKPYVETIELNTDSDSDDLKSRSDNNSEVKNAKRKRTEVFHHGRREMESEKSIVSGKDTIHCGQCNEITKTSDLKTNKLLFPKIVSVMGNFLGNHTQNYQDLNRRKALPNDVEKMSSASREFSETIKDEIGVNSNISDNNDNILEKIPRDVKLLNHEVKIEKTDIIKYENHCEDQDDLTRIIDPKLLMIPVICTTKLDDMVVLRNTNYRKTKGNHFIECVETESKIVKKEVLNESVSDHNTENCELRKVKCTSRVRRRPNCRNYTPTQIYKNPDFNIKLKRLSRKFFLNEQNKRLLNACTPVTIDIDRIFVDIDQQIVNNVNPIIKERIKSYENKNRVLVMPTNKLIPDKSMVTDKDLPNHNEKNIHQSFGPSLNSSLSQKNYERLNKNILTIEVSPLHDNHTDSNTKPPVKLVQVPTFQEDATSPSNSIINQGEKMNAYRTVSVISSTKERFIEKDIVKVDELLNPETSLTNSIIEGSNKSYTKNLLAIEVGPIKVSDTISNINPPVKLIQYPKNISQINSSLSRSNAVQEKENGESVEYSECKRIITTKTKEINPEHHSIVF